MSYGSMTTTTSDMVGQSFGPLMGSVSENQYPDMFSREMNPYPNTIDYAAKRYMIDPDLYQKIIWQESMGDVMAKNPNTGAYGPSQLLQDTADGLGVDRYDPYENIVGGAKLYSQLMQRYHNDKKKALAGYNWGPGNFHNVGDDLNRIPAETRKYIEHILGY